ncbi:MAG TPA: hypothetical protein VK437_02145 [Steroidobacteraceae bacterium]|nr:hypothetical protein [Steroidobacteraceae bacterium]
MTESVARAATVPQKGRIEPAVRSRSMLRRDPRTRTEHDLDYFS